MQIEYAFMHKDVQIFLESIYDLHEIMIAGQQLDD